MGKKGRPRNAVTERYPSGDQKRPAEKTIPPALWGRLKQLNDPLLSTEIGRLVYEGVLTRAQAEVGLRIGAVYERWHRLQKLRTSPKSANLEAGFAAGDDLAEERMTAERLEELETEAQAIERDFRAVDEEIKALPRNLQVAVMDVCVYSTATNFAMYPDLRKFLTRMGHFFVSGRKRGKKADLALLGGLAAPKPPPTTHAPPSITHIRRGDAIHLSWRIAVRKVVRHILPKLSEAEVERVLEIAVALRDREEVRLRKEPSLL